MTDQSCTPQQRRRGLRQACVASPGVWPFAQGRTTLIPLYTVKTTLLAELCEKEELLRTATDFLICDTIFVKEDCALKSCPRLVNVARLDENGAKKVGSTELKVAALASGIEGLLGECSSFF
ncbi:hypothetical protein HG530_005189 [Fusarium avenaceum]|nr:hypothetical protein HG530_005189 [Fusarium avenaceum]